jgi:hypothetical protein
MSQPNKKSAAQPAAKLASAVANKGAKEVFSTIESTRNSAENVVKLGTTAVKDFMAPIAGEAQKAQEKVFAMGREGAEHLAKSADTLTKIMHETIAISRDNVEACIECGNMTAALAKDVSNEVMESTNKAVSETMELSKDFFACRTFNDMFELQNKLMKHSIDNFFNQSVKLSGMFFEYANEALEPINERIADASEKFSKVMSA